ncbi:hypothetical protein INP51_10115 [Blautia liquoris]|mgnify:FL=1|jgi:hypothetical protein|uniref:Uncharacterized protein n=1 Tax=Blautia liquoris TaxID=2779518 RepID=A0A7M2REG2_9FIRM|nr:hypothetical protein [Blautia liquoris]QOV18371.1 hypothetical protein INP51_10115 [Blautia liquoris]
MKISILLEELIKISKVSKTDYALALHMTPSGLSKILSGTRFPLWKERKLFIRQSAVYFADATYSYNCYHKFQTLFPIVYDFNSKNELELFLTYAIGYALEYDYTQANHESIEYPDYEISYMGNQQILNMFCVILSDYIFFRNGKPCEAFLAPPVMEKSYSEIFSRIVYNPSEKRKRSKYHLFFNMDHFKNADDLTRIDYLEQLIKAHRRFDQIIHPTDGRIGPFFLLIRGKYLLYFTTLIDGIPLMTVIRQRNYQTIFYNSLMKRNYEPISYNAKELLDILEQKPDMRNSLNALNVDCVYNFISIGYLLTRKELDQLDASDDLKDCIYQYFQKILNSDTTFVVTINAMTNFFATGKALVPLLGYVEIPLEERTAYLRRLDSHPSSNTSGKIYILDQNMPNASIICSGDLTIIYLIDEDGNPEKIHIFQTEYMNPSIERILLHESARLLDFTPDLWDSYLKKMSPV